MTSDDDSLLPAWRKSAYAPLRLGDLSQQTRTFLEQFKLTGSNVLVTLPQPIGDDRTASGLYLPKHEHSHRADYSRLARVLAVGPDVPEELTSFDTRVIVPEFGGSYVYVDCDLEVCIFQAHTIMAVLTDDSGESTVP